MGEENSNAQDALAQLMSAMREEMKTLRQELGDRIARVEQAPRAPMQPIRNYGGIGSGSTFRAPQLVGAAPRDSGVRINETSA
ncbi:unnamed protein product [Arabis nemorensis]|uniref:Uncharacterized protein n=1 Tax=Arabis nemorensis TaxID=586526 RepID=A0A565CNY4_9BRAS|nr:unnamed protein product [Arabis nemorensis]